jgi:hypothetical protein
MQKLAQTHHTMPAALALVHFSIILTARLRPGSDSTSKRRIFCPTSPPTEKAPPSRAPPTSSAQTRAPSATEPMAHSQESKRTTADFRKWLSRAGSSGMIEQPDESESSTTADEEESASKSACPAETAPGGASLSAEASSTSLPGRSLPCVPLGNLPMICLTAFPSGFGMI